MQPLSAQAILKVWDEGQRQPPAERALTLLAAGCLGTARDDLAALSIGERDARLLALRERTFGSTLQGFVECPGCAERLEFILPTGSLRVRPGSAASAEVGDVGPQETAELVAEDLAVRFRLPDSRDLLAAAGCASPVEARRLLVERSVLEVSRDGVPVAAADLPASVVARLAARLAEWDPQADVLVDLRCPGCDCRWDAVFDIASFFWAELAAQARRLLREVHALATAYGWRETDILALSSSRRQAYLELVSG